MDRVVRHTSLWEPSFEEIFNLSLELLCIGGLDGYFKRVNPAFEEAFGYSSDELVSRPFLEFAHPEHRARSRDAFEQLARGQEVVRLENRNVRADGSALWLEWSARPVPGEPIFYGAGHDVTDRKRSESQLAAVRHVAALVASVPSPEEVFAAVAGEVGQLLGAENTLVYRYEAEDTAAVVAAWGEGDTGVPVGTRVTLEGESVAARVQRTRRPARLDDYANAPGSIAAMARNVGVRSGVGSPIVVEGRLWGAMVALSRQAEPLPAEAESRVGEFTQLVATAVANAEARAEVGRLAQEQAALRRVATLVARESSPGEVLAAVAEEVGRLLGVENTKIYRYDADGTATVAADWGDPHTAIPIGTRLSLDGENIGALVLRTERPVRIDDYAKATGSLGDLARKLGIRSGVGAPIAVEGRLWGVMVAATRQAEPLTPEAESRMGQFSQLVATAISNAEARDELHLLAEEQAALHRLATLVARGASPTAVFDAVSAEAARILDAQIGALARYEPDGTITVVASRSESEFLVPAGTRLPSDGEGLSSAVLRTGRAARMDVGEGATGSIGRLVREMGVRVAIGVPVVVEGRLWGTMSAGWTREEPPPADAEERIAQFTELLGTAIANADSRAQLTASRTRVLAAGDDARRRVVRDLHDGAQQRLVHTIVTLQLAQRALRKNEETADSLVAEGLAQAEQANAELRELAHGILPSVLSRGGLRAGIDALVSRMNVPVTVDVSRARFPPGIEASAYFVVAEALTNVVKHSGAERAEVMALADEGVLHIEVRDDGVGGAIPESAGLVELDDRVAAVGGRLRVESEAGGGTLVAAALPLPV